MQLLLSPLMINVGLVLGGEISRIIIIAILLVGRHLLDMVWLRFKALARGH